TYRAIGHRAAEVADLLVAKGEGARLAAQTAIGAGMPSERVHLTYAYEDAIRFLQETLRERDLLLVKGGASARLERVTQALLRDPATAPRILPRQEGGWRYVRLQRPGRPTWVEVDLDAIAGNVRRLRQIVTPQAQILAVLKADAYGHGASKVARVALNNGATWLGVACLGEALTLREQGIEAPILILGFTPAWQARQVVQNNISATVFSMPVAEALSQAARDLGRPARVHVKVDTGMGRLGLLPEEVLPFMREIARLPGLEIEGIFSHLAAADEEDLAYTYWQIARFEEALHTLQGE
ncbi:MAG: alanine racemase, partial [Chloroflexi bacterium]|nr:alanine racemase [Chloroflexota bacterium]